MPCSVTKLTNCRCVRGHGMAHMVADEFGNMWAFFRATAGGRFYFSAGPGYLVNVTNVMIPTNYRFVHCPLAPRRPPTNPGRPVLR